MAPKSFSNPIRVDPSFLRYEPFKERGQVRHFDSGESALDEFLNSEEVSEYENEKLGSTWLVFYEGELVAYYTIGTDSLRLEYVDSRKLSGRHFKKEERRVESIPSLKIGRLAVQRAWQSRGIGRLLLRRIAAIAYASEPAVRLLTVNSKEGSVKFYQAAGFEMTKMVRRERGRRERTMYLDLLAIRDQIEAGNPP